MERERGVTACKRYVERSYIDLLASRTSYKPNLPSLLIVRSRSAALYSHSFEFFSSSEDYSFYLFFVLNEMVWKKKFLAKKRRMAN